MKQPSKLRRRFNRPQKKIESGETVYLCVSCHDEFPLDTVVSYINVVILSSSSFVMMENPMEPRSMVWFSTIESEDDDEQRNRRRARNFRQRINFSRGCEIRFKEKFRISQQAFEFVLHEIGPKLQHETARNHALTPERQLMIALAWLGNGSQYHAIGRIHGVSKSTVHRCIDQVCRILVDTLMGVTIRWPTEDAGQIPQKFAQLSSNPFPNVAGLIDGSLINIDAPFEHEEAFVDRHGNHSINVLAVCGPNQEFYFITARWPGSVHDARILRNCELGRKWENGWRPFPNAVILGDSGFGLSEWLIPPIVRGPINASSARFLRAHRAIRRIIENAFCLEGAISVSKLSPP